MPPTDELTGWVAEEHHQHTKVLSPIQVDDNADDLWPYHPTPPERGVCSFKLVREPAGGPIAVVDVLPDNWHPRFVAVLQALRFRVHRDPVIGEFLMDPEVKAPADAGMGHGSRWRVTEWRIVRTRIDPRTLQVTELSDVIKWRDADGNEALSSYRWKPYEPRRGAPRVLSPQEWRPL